MGTTSRSQERFRELAELIHSEWDRIEAEACMQGQLNQHPDAAIEYAVSEIECLLEGRLKTHVQFGKELFRFTSFPQWVNKASSWFRGAGLYGTSGYVCVDANGRICQVGRHFTRAREEDSFPIIVYLVE